MKLSLSEKMIEEVLVVMEVDLVEGKETAAVTAAAMAVVWIEQRRKGVMGLNWRSRRNERRERKVGLFLFCNQVLAGREREDGGGGERERMEDWILYWVEEIGRAHV